MEKTAIVEPSRFKSFVPELWSFLEFAVGSLHYWWAICLCCAGILAWAARHSMNPDGLSYLDLASEAVSGGPSKLVNGYWSPGYPALISIALFLFRPSPEQEFPLVHFVNFLIFVVALWAFSVFFRYWLPTTQGGEVVSEKTKRYVTPFAFCTFLWFTLKFIGMEFVNPDLGVAAAVLLAAGITCRLSLPGSSWKHYTALGLVLGAGYYVKAVMFPLSIIFLGFLFLWPVSGGGARRKLLLSVSVFLLVASPLLVALSVRANRLSFGEVGRLTYAWYVNGLRWTGGSEEHESAYQTPDHPAPKLLQRPVTLEFASPISGTYPLWYDPSYWYAGAKARFDLRQQMAGVRETLRAYKSMALDTMAFIAGAIVLCVLILHDKVYPKLPRSLWWQLAWPLAAFTMYALVHVERRFLGAFFVLLWLAIYAALTIRMNRRISAAVCATVLSTVMLPFAARLAITSVGIARDLVHPRPPAYQIAAHAFRDLGLQNGDRLAVVGYAHDCYYARCARLRVVAQIPDTNEFWHLTTPELTSVAERLASIGVKAVVAPNRPATSARADWKDVNVSNSMQLSILLLSPQAPGRSADPSR